MYKPTMEEMLEVMTASDERIAFCFKLWIKEIIDDWNPTEFNHSLIMYAFNEILNGEYCSDEEFAARHFGAEVKRYK